MCATTAMNTPCSPKTVVLYGSPRPNGATATVLAMVQECVPDATVIDCFARAVAPCDDCRGCYTHDGCVKRDMDDVYARVEQADKLVLLTPVYNRSFPAPMKALIDRLQCYWAARFIHGKKPPIATPKTAVVITVCGSDRDDGTCVLYQLEPQLTVLHVTDTKSLHIKGSDGDIDWETVKTAVCEQMS